MSTELMEGTSERCLSVVKYFARANPACIPSTAALTIPPAYPAPSPIGYRPAIVTDSKLSVILSIRTGELVLVSTP
jgi:hypothetical protein